MLNLIVIILSTFDNIIEKHLILLHFFEVFSVGIFTVEYFMRLITCDFKYPAKKNYISLFKYVFSFIAIIDLLSILPFYLPFIFRFDLRFLRAFRLFRIFRLFKIGRYSNSLKIIGNVFKSKKQELVITISFMFLLLIMSSILMFYVEHEVQPEEFPNAIRTLWWAVATLTTIGYGDVFPITDMGRILSAIIAIIGIGFIALPTGILSSGFMEEINKINKKEVNKVNVNYEKQDELINKINDLEKKIDKYFDSKNL